MEDMVKKVFDAGVVGAGGAGFPTHVKLQAKGIDTYLINCAECEPLLTVDQHLMLAHTQRLVGAANDVAAFLGASKVVFGLKGKYHAQIEALKSCGATVGEMGNFYPAGDEAVMISDILERKVPEAGLPLQVGVVVNNPETVLAIADAIDGVPFTHTYVTVGGAVNKRGIWRVPIGVSMGSLLIAAGGASIDDPAYIEGGPMTGRYFMDNDFLNTPVTKTTKGLLVVPKTSKLVKYETMSIERMLKQAKAACIQCSQCTLVCSRNLIGYKLEPHKIMRTVAYSWTQGAELGKIAQQAFLCSECNLCSGIHACPMELSPRRVNQVLKGRLRAAGIKPDFPRRDIKTSEERKWRLLSSKRLVKRIGLDIYEGPSPYMGDLPVGNELEIMLKQGAGAPVLLRVTQGQSVEANELLGTPPEGALGTSLHSPIAGKVTNISQHSVTIQKAQEGND